MRIFAVESLRFPEEGSSSQGKSGPKPRTAVVGDGHQVDIPELTHNCLKGGGTQEDRHASDWKSLLSSVGRVCRKIRRPVIN